MTEFEEIIKKTKEFIEYDRTHIIRVLDGTLYRGPHYDDTITWADTTGCSQPNIKTNEEVIDEKIEKQAELTRQATANIIAEKDEEIKTIHNDIKYLEATVNALRNQIIDSYTGETSFVSKQDFEDLKVKYNSVLDILQRSIHGENITYIDLRGYQKL